MHPEAEATLSIANQIRILCSWISHHHHTCLSGGTDGDLGLGLDEQGNLTFTLGTCGLAFGEWQMQEKVNKMS